MKLRDLIRLLESNGFYLKRMSKHIIYSNGLKTIAIPHQKDVKSWTVNKIMKEAGIQHQN